MRQAFRSLRRSPLTAGGVVATLGLALGAGTVIASLVSSVLLDSLPGRRPQELVRIFGQDQARHVDDAPLSITKFEALRNRPTGFAGVAADFATTFAITGFGEPSQARGFKVTANYFDVLGTRPELGRVFRADEESAGSPVALVSHELWSGLLRGDPAAVGGVLILNGIPHTVVGVLPPQPRGWFGQADVWTTQPFDNPSYPRALLERGVSFLRVIARRAPGVSSAAAESALASVAAEYRASHADNADAAWSLRVRTLEDDAVGALRPALRALLAAAGLVLLIAGSNAANLMTVRFLGRSQELAVRRALGAGRARILRLLLAEGALLGLFGGALGVVLAGLLLQASPYLAAGGLLLAPRLLLEGRALVFGLVLGAACGLLAALLPAARAASLREIPELGHRGAGSARGENRARSLLLALQVALSFALLAGALLLSQSFARLLHAPVGFAADHVFTASVSLPPARYPDGPAQARFAALWLERLREAPGAQTAAIAQGLALTGHDRQSPYARADREVPPLKDRPLALVRSVTPNYFATLGIGLVAGRDFGDVDRAGAPQTVILSRGAERTLYPEGRALGHHLLLSSEGGGLDVEVVGVVGDVRSVSPELDNAVEFYRPLAQRPSPYLQVALRSSHDSGVEAAILRSTLHAVDPLLPLTAVAPMGEVLADALARRLALTALIGAFAALALLLAAVGVGGVAATLVERRAREIGIRLALGAPRRAVRSMLLRDGLVPVGWGLAAGLAAFGGLAPWLRSQLYGTTPWNPFAVGGSAVVLGTIAFLACALPARRANRIDPADCLRDG